MSAGSRGSRRRGPGGRRRWHKRERRGKRGQQQGWGRWGGGRGVRWEPGLGKEQGSWGGWARGEGGEWRQVLGRGGGLGTGRAEGEGVGRGQGLGGSPTAPTRRSWAGQSVSAAEDAAEGRRVILIPRSGARARLQDSILGCGVRVLVCACHRVCLCWPRPGSVLVGGRVPQVHTQVVSGLGPTRRAEAERQAHPHLGIDGNTSNHPRTSHLPLGR